MTKGLRPGFQKFGPRWKQLHRLTAAAFKPKAVDAYRTIQDLESKQLVFDLLHSNDPLAEFERYAASFAFALTFGERHIHNQVPAALRTRELLDCFVRELNLINLLVDVVPILQRLPERFSRWRRVGNWYHQRLVRTVTQQHMNLALESGSWNLVRELVGKKEMNDLSWEQLCYIVDELDVGTHITTVIALSIFVMICLQHPDAVSRAQRDLDSVVGPNRLPEFDDIENLPYMHAFINDMLRWQPVTPFGAPHGLTTDDEYMGYRIPKDAIILPHHWSIGRSPEVHGDPEVFRPER
ncbi:cytochrome P450 [Penicillium canescens]|nr:cytochrome P450 [Penicillium canescens]KAJ6154856.1 cytochrome P450 [Penicillium canescens]